jgi:hypothetical protein
MYGDIKFVCVMMHRSCRLLLEYPVLVQLCDIPPQCNGSTQSDCLRFERRIFRLLSRYRSIVTSTLLPVLPTMKIVEFKMV